MTMTITSDNNDIRKLENKKIQIQCKIETVQILRKQSYIQIRKAKRDSKRLIGWIMIDFVGVWYE